MSPRYRPLAAALLALGLAACQEPAARSGPSGPSRSGEPVTDQIDTLLVETRRFPTTADFAARAASTAALYMSGHDWERFWEDQARALAKEGYAALAVDLYRGKVATQQEDAHQLMMGLPPDRALRDLRGAEVEEAQHERGARVVRDRDLQHGPVAEALLDRLDHAFHLRRRARLLDRGRAVPGHSRRLLQLGQRRRRRRHRGHRGLRGRLP